MNISSPFIHRPVMTTFVCLAILVAGIMAYLHLPVNDLPNIDYPAITVRTEYRGASPEAVLNQVTIPLERELTQVKGVQEITSTSNDSFSSITMQFDLHKDMNEAIRDIQSALNRADNLLPEHLEQRPVYYREERNQEPIMYLFLHSDQVGSGDLRAYVDTYITPRLSRIEGVAKINVFGAEKTVKIEVNPDLMAARHIGFNEVIDAVRNYTTHMPLGSIKTENKVLSLELSGEIKEAKELYNLPIGKGLVRLKDIASISQNQAADDEPEFHFVTKNSSSSAIGLFVEKISDANAVTISD
ncbi:MAG: efflux RND transporter permease subunit, partial [Verrucomicrobia bacterium]|nr:efflux RND transporter permease subunit [Verrucomicrobiota bacterium]